MDLCLVNRTQMTKSCSMCHQAWLMAPWSTWWFAARRRSITLSRAAILSCPSAPLTQQRQSKGEALHGTFLLTACCPMCCVAIAVHELLHITCPQSAFPSGLLCDKLLPLGQSLPMQLNTIKWAIRCCIRWQSQCLDKSLMCLMSIL